MDLSVILEGRLAVGGGIWTAKAMAELADLGYTHIVNLQDEFDDSALAAEAGLAADWNPTEDNFEPKPPDFFERSTRFALQALRQPGNQVYVHCAAGIHRGPLIAAAILCGLGYDANRAMHTIATRRVGADFPDVYADSLRGWLASRA